MGTKRYGTKAHNIRIPSPVWRKAGVRAAREGTTRAAVINAALEEYGKDEPDPGPAERT